MPIFDRPTCTRLLGSIEAGHLVILCGAGLSIQISTENKLAEALDRAAKAETALLEFRKSRRSLMTAGNKARLRERLLPFAGTEFDTAYGSGGEQMHFLWDLEEVMHSANWRQLPWTVNVVGNTLTRFRSQRPGCGVVDAENVELQLQPEWRQKNEAASKALIEGLSEIGIAASEAPLITPNTNMLAIHVLIGPKG
jgi:hypothetical protein